MPYDRNNDGYEYYGTLSYAKNRHGDEYYAKGATGEYYLKINNYDVLAKHKFNGKMVEYFALGLNDNPICPIMENNPIDIALTINIAYPKKAKKELYPELDGKQYYICDDQGNMKYAKNELNVEYPILVNGKPVYAYKISQDNDKIEFLPKDQNGKSYCVKNDSNNLIYPLNITKDIPIYNLDNNLNEMYEKIENMELYAYNSKQLPFYAKLKSGDQYAAHMNNNEPYYAVSGGKYHFQYYPKMKSQKQFYLKINGIEKYAHQSKEIYAKDENNCEYAAKNEEGKYYYITDKKGLEHYPKLENGEYYYVINDRKEIIAINKKSGLGFYLKDKYNDEVYPKDFNPVIPKPLDQSVNNYPVPRDPTDEELLNHTS